MSLRFSDGFIFHNYGPISSAFKPFFSVFAAFATFISYSDENVGGLFFGRESMKVLILFSGISLSFINWYNCSCAHGFAGSRLLNFKSGKSVANIF